MSESEIRVCLMKRSGRKYFEAQWRDPITGLKQTESTKKSNRRDAERVAALIEGRLREGLFKRRRVILWAEFRERFETEKLPGLAANTTNIYSTTFNTVERIISPKRLQSVDSSQVSKLQSVLRRERRSEATIKSYLRHLKSALRWAVAHDLLPKMPTFEMPRRTTEMKGRGITTEEYERMLGAVPKVVGVPVRLERTRAVLKLIRCRATDCSVEQELNRAIAECDRTLADVISSWKFFITGLWLSGLRLGEALTLHWVDDHRMKVELSLRRPMFQIQALAQKSNKYELLPMAPEFAEFLSETPARDRTGFVFHPRSMRGGTSRLRLDTTSSILCDIGRSAGIKVSEKNGKVKYASAHDLRRAFGCRWAHRVMPPILKQLMRHQNIATTMEYYVGKNAEEAADVLWKAVNSGDPSSTRAAARPLSDDEESMAGKESPQARHGTRR